MNVILPITAIFIFVLILFFLSQIVVKIIWKYKKKFKSTKTLETLMTAIALSVWFIILMLAIFSATNILVNSKVYSSSNSATVKNTENIFDLADCQKLINAIYIGESQIYDLENHHYLEKVATPKTIKSDYNKGAEKLRLIAEQYLKLDLNSESESYSQIIANKLQEKAQLFEQRMEFTSDTDNKQEVNQLLNKMDIVTQERLRAIEFVENQCNPK